VDEGIGVGSGDKVAVGESVGVDVEVGVGSGVAGGVTTEIYPARLIELVNVLFRIVRFTVYVPGVSYTCSGFRTAVTLVLYHVPSPNDQFHNDGRPPVDVSEKSTVKGAVPSLGEAVKFNNNGAIPAAYFRSPFPPSR
jgi:hypothetical protein